MTADQLRCFVADTVTGHIVRDLPIIGAPSWASGLNMQGELSVTVPLGDSSGAVSKVDLDGITDPWKWSLGLAYGAKILQCGPIVGESYADDSGSSQARIQAVGLWGLLNRRLLLHPTMTGGPADTSADSSFGPSSLHTIAKGFIANDLTRNGALPIVLPADIAGTHARSYNGHDLASVGERLLDLSQADQGPEIELAPEYVDYATRTAVQWRARIGNPHLGDTSYPHAWDYGQACSHIDVDRDGSRMTFRSFVRGTGMEHGLLTGTASTSTYTALGWPMLESVNGDHISETEQPTLDDWASADIAGRSTETKTWSAVVRIDGLNGAGQPTRGDQIRSINNGNNATFRVSGHRRIADGTYLRRIIGMRDGRDLSSVRLILQPTTGV
jgi:hypothetical protein